MVRRYGRYDGRELARWVTNVSRGVVITLYWSWLVGIVVMNSCVRIFAELCVLASDARVCGSD